MVLWEIGISKQSGIVTTRPFHNSRNWGVNRTIGGKVAHVCIYICPMYFPKTVKIGTIARTTIGSNCTRKEIDTTLAIGTGSYPKSPCIVQSPQPQATRINSMNGCLSATYCHFRKLILRFRRNSISPKVATIINLCTHITHVEFKVCCALCAVVLCKTSIVVAQARSYCQQ